MSTIRTTLVTVGNDQGVILPEEWLKQMGLDIGSTVFIEGIPDGISITPHHPDEKKQS